MNEITIRVLGMRCGSCVHSVTVGLERLPGVRGVKVDLPSGKVVVRHDGPAPSEDTLRRALDEMGYDYAGFA